MTSGNPGGEPICLGNREARARLDTMADAFLFHNRDILIRVDDSVTRPLPDGGTLFHRRARGYVPRPIVIDAALSGEGAGVPCVFGAGADLKNTLCLTKGADAFVSQHIGDMNNVETGHFHGEIREHLAGLLRVRPDVLVRDRHPDFLSGRLSDEYAGERGLPVMTLQHHAAHAFALLAEHAFRGRALVLALDGTGLGTDGALWGGELLLADTGAARRGEAGWKRLGHMAPMDLPGGEAAIREPWRIAHALLWRLGLLDGGGDAAFSPPWLPERAATAALLPTMLVRGVNNPSSTSCGRFFDAASALLGLCDVITYEGQAAIRLEEAQGPARPWDVEPERLYPCPVTRPERGGPLLLDSRALFRVLALDKAGGPEQSQNAEMALRFHHSLARGLVDMAVLAAGEHGLDCVGLSGGCLHNLTLSTLLTRGLEAHGLRVLRHEQLSPGDGCISLGQAFWGRLAAGGR
jgi:hydrogenase maturation protein HypF